MMYSIQYNSRASRRKILSAVITAVFCLGFMSRSGFAQQELTSPTSPSAAVPPPQWVIGPATANLGNAAQITVPEGCRFTDENFARVVLASSKEPIPNNLMGLLFPDSRQWFAILQFTEIGRVKVGEKEILDADTILKKYRTDIERQNKQRSAQGPRPAVADLSWELKPSYDAIQNKLEYALRAKSMGGGSINYVVNLLGRRGVLSVTIVQPDQAGFSLTALRDATKGIIFKNGERYSDYQPEDRVARAGLSDLILNSNGNEPLSRLERLAQNKWFWMGAAVGVLVLLVGGYILTAIMVRKAKARYYRMDEKFHRAPAMTAQAAAANGHAVNGSVQSQVELGNGQAALRPNGGFQRNAHRRRKKRFSYHAFYSDMVMNLTRCNYVGSPGGHANGQSPANLDGPQTQDIVQNATSVPDAANLLVTETSKLIQSQQKLIEGQRKLIEEQSKLIQEKSMLLNAESRAAGKTPETVAEQQLT